MVVIRRREVINFVRFFIFCALERFPGVLVVVLGARRLITVGINRRTASHNKDR